MNANTLAVMESVELYVKEMGESPSLLDLMDLTGLKSTAAVNYHIKALICEGYLGKDKYKQRALVVLRDSSGIQVPTLADVAREPNGRVSRSVKAHLKHTPKLNRIDMAEAKRIKAARDAIRLKRLKEENARRREGLDERMDRVVAEAKARESSKGDPFYNSQPLFQNSRVCGSRLG